MIESFPSERLIDVMNALKTDKMAKTRIQGIAERKNLTLNTNDIVRIGHLSGDNDIDEKEIPTYIQLTDSMLTLNDIDQVIQIEAPTGVVTLLRGPQESTPKALPDSPKKEFFRDSPIQFIGTSQLKNPNPTENTREAQKFNGERYRQ